MIPQIFDVFFVLGGHNRILGVDMYRATALSMVLWLGLLEATEACGEDECNWTQPLHYFEQLSGLFFLLSGLGNAVSILRNLQRGYRGCCRSSGLRLGGAEDLTQLIQTRQRMLPSSVSTLRDSSMNGTRKQRN